MLTVTLTKGLPASGKSTWTKSMVDKFPNTYKRVNKDDLRAMLDNSKHSKDNEKFVLQIRDALILNALDNGKHVIVDDTNLAPKHETHIRQLVKGKAEVIIKDFTDVPIETCIERDLKRTASVGEKVIRGMYKQFLMKQEKYTENKKLPKAIIVDIDGTLAKMKDRSPFDWKRVKEDSCNEIIKDIVNAYKNNVFIFSGRDGSCRTETIEWLSDHGICYKELFMRPAGNNEKDNIIKQRLFEQHMRGKYYVEYILDDRNQVVEMWRSLGLVCLQVAEGDF
jgi:predicted kinase